MASTTVKPPSSPPPPSEPRKPSGVARATGLMMATVLLSRILGVLRDAIISHYFGRGPQTDAYNAAFTVPDLLFYLLQSGALSSTIVPIITEYRQQGKHRTADQTVSIVASVIFVVIGLLICLMWIGARQLTVFLNPGFDAYRIGLAVPLTRVLLPAQMFFFLGGLMMGVLYSRKQFLIPALGPVIYNSGIIFGGVVLRRWLGIEGLVWGAIGGAFVGNFLIPFLAVRRLGIHLRPSFAVLHPGARKVWMMLLPIGLGVSLPNIDQMVNKAFASYLGEGDTTAIMNAYRLMLLPIGVFAQAMALAVYPTLSEQAGLKNIKAMRGTMNQSLRNILFLTVPASALMFLLAEPIITFLLQSGKYTHADTQVTASALRFLSLGIFAWSCQSLLTRGFYALQNSKVPVISGAIVSVLFVGMNWAVIHRILPVQARIASLQRQAAVLNDKLAAVQPLLAAGAVAQAHLASAEGALSHTGRGAGAQTELVQAQTNLDGLIASAQATASDTQNRLAPVQARLTAARADLRARSRWGVAGLGLATSIAAAIHMLALLWLLRRRLHGIGGGALTISIAKTLLATGGLCLATWLARAFLESHLLLHIPKLQAAAVLIGAGVLGIAAFVALARALRMNELQAALNMVRRRKSTVQ